MRLRHSVINLCCFNVNEGQHRFTATINISRKIPDFLKIAGITSESQAYLNQEDYLKKEAKILFDTLKDTLPQKTLWELFSLMKKDYEEGQCQE